MTEGGRTAILVLVCDGQVRGSLPPINLAVPWWPEMSGLVAAVREQFGIAVTVLRLLGAESDRPSGGLVTYLAETTEEPEVALEPWPGDPVRSEPRRQDWATPGGPALILGWAEEQLAIRGISQRGQPEQMRSWNLSAIWKLATTAGPVWLKAVPDFFAHEGAVMDVIGPAAAPRLLGHAWGRVLMVDIPGEPNHDARGPALLSMVRRLTELQDRCRGRVDDLLAVGLPDRRLPMMLPQIEMVVAERSGSLDPSERRALDVLVEEMPQRLADIDQCGVPDTLVHGDFHSGNVAGSPGRYTILDWGDSFLGHPLIDNLAFALPLNVVDQAAVHDEFVAAWRRILPDAEPERAAGLLRPLLPLLAAAMYARFCAAIEPDECIYHDADIVAMLHRAAITQA